MFPGLCGDAAAAPLRVFLGTQPVLAVEQRLLRQIQPVFPWFTSRKRVKEQANDFLEIDLAAIDGELMLRYPHVFYVRRQVFDESVEKQLALLEGGKAPKMADQAVMDCLTGIHVSVAKQIHTEIDKLREIKKLCTVAGRRELDPTAPLHYHDLLCMMRVAEEDAVTIPDVESRCKSFLTSERIHGCAVALAKEFFGSETKYELDKKDQRLWSRMFPSDYSKVGCVEKYRPTDVAGYYRFFGERACKQSDAFRRGLWGNIFRKFATHPHYLCSVSQYWSVESGLDTKPNDVTLPMDLAKAAATQASLFPAMKFRTMYFYTSPEIAKTAWRLEAFVPHMKLFPLMGHTISEETLAWLLVEDFWRGLGISDDGSVTNDAVIRAVKQFVSDVSSLREANAELLLTKVSDCAPKVIPVTESEAPADKTA